MPRERETLRAARDHIEGEADRSRHVSSSIRRMRGEETLKKFLPHVLAKFRVRSVYFCTGREEVLSKNERRAKKKEKNKLGGNRPKFPDIPPPPRRFQKFPGEKKLHFPSPERKNKASTTELHDGIERALFNSASSGRSTRETSFQFRASFREYPPRVFPYFPTFFPRPPCFHVRELTIQRLVRVPVIEIRRCCTRKRGGKRSR